MKKLAALLFSCIVITGAFASCGKKSSSSDSSKIDSGNSSVSDSDDLDTEISDIEDAGEISDDTIEGSWSMNGGEDSNEMIMIFNNGVLSVESDFSFIIGFNGKNLIVGGEDYGSEGTVLEGDKLTFTIEGMELINMTRIEGSGDSLDGTYSELGGLLLGDLGEDYSGVVTKARIEGDKFFICYENFCNYAVEDDDKVILKNPPEMFETGSADNEAVLTFKIDGDTLFLTDKEGKTDTLTRVK